jgi:hypothetical protein
VKTRILNLGISATHKKIEALGSIADALSISDFDAFVFDPNLVQHEGASFDVLIRRQREISDLLHRKGGVVICLLRQPLHCGVIISSAQADTLTILDLAANDAMNHIRPSLRVGSGSQVELVRNAIGASTRYFRVLSGALRFAAYIDRIPDLLKTGRGTVFAANSVGHPIGVEFAVGAGIVCFVPVPQGAAGDRVGAAIVQTVDAHYGGPTEIEFPSWLVEIGVPNATLHDAPISELEERKKQVEAEIESLKQKRAEVLKYRILLYGYGKSILEPVVRSAFRLLGFEVPEPDHYEGEWDVEVRESSASAIGEVEGSEGVIDVDKYRQLLDYVQAEALEGRDHKGILIGNGYRLTPPEAPERQSQFSPHALRGAHKNNFCLLPSTELFKAVCAVLEAPEDEGRKIAIRSSIFSTVGVWTFAREAAQQDPATENLASSDQGQIVAEK